MRIRDCSSDVCSSDLMRARTEEQLGGATVELLASRAPLLAEPLPAAAIDWATSLTAAADHDPGPAAEHAGFDPVPAAGIGVPPGIGRASGRERVCQYV